MKNIIYIFIILFLHTLGAESIYAQDKAVSPVPSPSQISYELVFPGLLPDHPLYFLKAGRERTQAFFISNPFEKAEYNLLQADKRIHAALMLSKKGKDKLDLTQSTFSKGENYFEQSIKYAKDAKSEGINIAEFSKKLRDANQKHQQIFDDITKKLNPENKKKFTKEAERLIFFEKVVSDLARQK